MRKQFGLVSPRGNDDLVPREAFGPMVATRKSAPRTAFAAVSQAGGQSRRRKQKKDVAQAAALAAGGQDMLSWISPETKQRITLARL